MVPKTPCSLSSWIRSFPTPRPFNTWSVWAPELINGTWCIGVAWETRECSWPASSGESTGNAQASVPSEIRWKICQKRGKIKQTEKYSRPEVSRLCQKSLWEILRQFRPLFLVELGWGFGFPTLTRVKVVRQGFEKDPQEDFEKVWFDAANRHPSPIFTCVSVVKGCAAV